MGRQDTQERCPKRLCGKDLPCQSKAKSIIQGLDSYPSVLDMSRNCGNGSGGRSLRDRAFHRGRMRKKKDKKGL